MHPEKLSLSFVVAVIVLSPTVGLGDWPTYRADASRSGYTSEQLAGELHSQWEFQLPHAPEPAWPRDERMPFDRAPQVVAAGNRALLGSTVDGKIYAIHPETGKVAWTFATDGPIRFAPAIWKDRAFCVSDDGHLYALQLSDGRLLWKRRGGLDHRSILGNERLISKWPARGGAAVVGDTVYFAAGIWPSDGIFLYALDAETGETQWVNDTAGGIYMAQPHGGANARSGVSAQGYLVASGDHLFVPTGRAVPASFDRKTGAFRYFHLQKYGHNGGAPTMAVRDLFFNSGISFSASSGQKVSAIEKGQIAATPDGLVRQLGRQVFAYRWTEGTTFDRRGKAESKPTLTPLWETDGIVGGSSLIVAGQHVVCGGENRVTLVDGRAHKASWSAELQGTAYGLAVHDGRLLVSTDQGRIYCFAAKPSDAADNRSATDEITRSPYAEDARYERLAREILSQTDLKHGYCVDLGCGDGALAYHLARLSKLRIYAVESDPELAELARRRLTQAGVYGQVIVHHRPLEATGYPKYFADLIVSRRQMDDPEFNVLTSTIKRMQRPCGGVVCSLQEGEIASDVRGPLPGAGEWTHQYSAADNSLNSGDSRIKGRLSMLWFRDVSFDIPQRHGRAPAPLYSDGRLFHAGLDGIVAVDAYNGRELWRHEIEDLLRAYDGDELMGTAGTGSNFCVEGGSVYVRDEKRCLRIDAATGQLLSEFPTPTTADGKPGTWGYVASVDGTLFGTVANSEHVVTYRYVNRGGDMKRLLTESRSLFAMDNKEGSIRWQYDAKDSIRHNAIAIGKGIVFLIDRPLAMFDREKKPTDRTHPTGALVAIDTSTGRELWRNTENIYGTLLSYSQQHETVLMAYQPTRFRLDSEIGGRMAAFDSKTGKRRWDIEATYRSRPMINNGVVYAEGGAWDLLTGAPKPFTFSRSYGCGVLAGSEHMMLFRSATLGYFNLNKDAKKQADQTLGLNVPKVENFGGIRPGCWINAIPAGGIVMVPDASSGCRCSYLNKAWFALDSDPRVEPQLEPAGGAWRQPIHVKIAPDEEATAVHYTLDGSTPNEKSPRYTAPVLVRKTSLLKARSFYEDGTGSPVSSAEYQIDPKLLPLSGPHWTTWDTPGPDLKNAPSDWKLVGNEIVQSANIHEGNSGVGKPEDRRDGTLRIYRDPDSPLEDGVFSAQIRSIDNDGVGLAFRVESPDKLYLLALDAQRKFQILAVRDGKQYRVLDQNSIGYVPNRWHDVRIQAKGDTLTVYFDGEQVLQAVDKTIQRGGVALYSWGNSGVSFRNLKIE